MLVSAAREGLQRLGLLSPKWPYWAVDTFVSVSLCCAALVAGQWLYDRRRSRSPPSGDGLAAATAGGKGGNEVVAGPAAAARFRRLVTEGQDTFINVV